MGLHLLTFYLFLTASIVKLALNDLQWTDLQVVWEVLTFNVSFSTLVWTLQRISFTFMRVVFRNFLVSGFVGAVRTHKPALWAKIPFMPLQVTTLDPPTTQIRARYFSVLALAL